MLFSLLLLAKRAEACAACAAQDPTLPSGGAEAPFRGRLRATFDARFTSSRAGGYDGSVLEVAERRLDFGAAYAPSDDWLVDAKLPIFERVTRDLSRDVHEERWGLGDVEATATYAVWKSEPSRTRRRLGLVLGAKAPTAPTLGTPSRAGVLPASLQPGCASVVAEVGVYYMLSRGPWSMQTSGTLLMPFAVRDAPHTGDSLRLGSSVQLQPVRAFAARLGALARVDGSGEYAKSDDPSSGGALGYLSTEIVIAPMPDVVMSAGAWFPALSALRGVHHEGPIAVISAGYDF